MSKNQNAVAAAAGVGGERVTKTITFALTGDAVSDTMSGIRMVCDELGLSARQMQFLFECYAKLYKDAADSNDQIVNERNRLAEEWKKMQMANPPPPPFTTTDNTGFPPSTWGGLPGATGTGAVDMAEWQKKLRSEMIREVERPEYDRVSTPAPTVILEPKELFGQKLPHF